MPERVNELRDGVTRPFNVTTEGRQGSLSGIPVKTIAATTTVVLVEHDMDGVMEISDRITVLHDV